MEVHTVCNLGSFVTKSILILCLDVLAIKGMLPTSRKVSRRENPFKPLQNDLRELTIAPADIISTVEFDHTGNYLATGDKGGRVVLFERNETVSITYKGAA